MKPLRLFQRPQGELGRAADHRPVRRGGTPIGPKLFAQPTIHLVCWVEARPATLIGVIFALAGDGRRSDLVLSLVEGSAEIASQLYIALNSTTISKMLAVGRIDG